MDKVKMIGEILASKPKFRRSLIIVGMVCTTLVVITIVGFYMGAISWHGK